MKLFAITVALAGLVVAAPMNAQILSSRIPTTTSRGTANNGQWYSVGRDNNGNTIYERQTYDNNGNTVIQRARRNSNGTFTIISSRTVNNGNTNGDCTYNRTTNSVGDIVFGRSGNVNCNDRGNRTDGGWYQVGNGRNNNSIYERRTRDANGNVIIQRARRNSNGTFTIISTRNAGNGNGSWNNGRGNNGNNDDNWNNGNRNNQDDKQWRKDQKRQEKESRKSNKHGNKGNHENDD